MVRQWQELIHGGRYSESYTESLPDFVKLAESFGILGLRAEKSSEVDKTALKTFLINNLGSYMVPKRLKIASISVGHRFKRS